MACSLTYGITITQTTEMKRLSEIVKKYNLTVRGGEYNTDFIITQDGEIVTDTNLPVSEVCYRVEEYFRSKREEKINDIID